MDEVPESSILTHWGKARADGTCTFIEEPKWRPQFHEPWVEIDVSMMEGRLDVETASRLICRMPLPEKQLKKKAVRYFLTRDLLANRYYAIRTPTAGIPTHVSVYGDMAAIAAACPEGAESLVATEAHRSWWRDPNRVTLEVLEIERKAGGQ